MNSSILSRKTYFIRTFGCQMNLHDSERVSGLLDSLGCLEVGEPSDADIVVFMTCCVREAADTRLYGQCSSCKSLPKPPSGRRVIAVGGCIAQRDGEGLLTNLDNVDVIFGTHSIAHVGELIARAFEDGDHHVRCEEIEDKGATSMPWHRATTFHSWVPIMTGCNNFCSYCIVPYVRGREKSREPEAIVEEIKALVADGVTEVMLLGQNVNSYGKTLEHPVTFAQLLKQVEAIEGLKRIRFMTSHPKDLSDELIQTMAESKKVCHHLHLPMQSGSSRILKIMNRRYDKEKYLELVSKIRKAVPDISLTTDIIVGFPGETEEDFQDTLDVVEKCDFDSAFTFIYSKRSGTPAAKMENQVPEDVVKDRFDRLLALVQEKGRKASSRFEGTVQEILVEEESKEKGIFTGRTEYNLLVHFPGCQDLIGKYVKVKLDTCKGFYYFGTLVD